MKSNDLRYGNGMDSIREAMQKALRDNDSEGVSNAFCQMMDLVRDDILQDYEELRDEKDALVLRSRGIRQLTSKETEYYQKLAEAMRARNPAQALANLDVVMPETVIDSVLQDLETNHPLLSKIDFMSTGGAIRMIMNTNGYQRAQWGELCDEIVKELISGFKEVDTGLFELSAFLPVCMAMLDLGPQWLDSYVRRVISEALANGMEYGILVGDGASMPIGMCRQVGEGVTVTGGKYPEKAPISVTDLSVATIGRLLSLLAAGPNGQSRIISNLIMVVNPQDYFQRVMPSTTVMAPDGTYRNNVLPYPIDVIQSAALPRGKAIIGLAKRYFAALGTVKDGRLQYSDHVKFLESKRIYLGKLYGNGMPKDDNAFFVLDISNLSPAAYKVTLVDAPAASSDARLSSLKIGSLSLSPAFSGATTTYAATTKNETNTITAVPSEAGANISVRVNDQEVDNGSAVAWTAGSNAVVIEVTAADGNTVNTYNVTVTKS